jgi:hypothetical protein
MRFCWRKGVTEIRSFLISLASSPNSRGRDPQSLTRAAFSLDDADEINRQERTHQKEWQQFKLRNGAERSGKGEC